MNDLTQYETASAQLATIRDSAERDRALELTRRLKALYTDRKAALDAIVAPLRERIDEAKRQARLEDIEGFSRRVLAAVADYDKRQAAAKADEARARLDLATTQVVLKGVEVASDQVGGGRTMVTEIQYNQVPQAEPVKPVPTRRDIVVTDVDSNVLPREYMIANTSKIKQALKIGTQIPGVKWEWSECPVWTK